MSMVQFDISGRATGKTCRLARWLERNRDAVVLTPFGETGRRHLRNLGIAGSRIYTVEETKSGRLQGRPASPLAIEDLDALLYQFTGGLPVSYVTASGVLVP